MDDVVKELGAQSEKEKLPSQQEIQLDASLPDLLEMLLHSPANRALNRPRCCSAAPCEVSKPKTAPLSPSSPVTMRSYHHDTSTLQVPYCTQKGWRG